MSDNLAKKLKSLGLVVQWQDIKGEGWVWSLWPHIDFPQDAISYGYDEEYDKDIALDDTGFRFVLNDEGSYNIVKNEYAPGPGETDFDLLNKSEHEVIEIAKNYFFGTLTEVKQWRVPFHKHPDWSHTFVENIENAKTLFIDDWPLIKNTENGTYINTSDTDEVGLIAGKGKVFYRVSGAFDKAVEIVGANDWENYFYWSSAKKILEKQPDHVVAHAKILLSSNNMSDWDLAIALIRVLPAKTYSISEELTACMRSDAGNEKFKDDALFFDALVRCQSFSIQTIAEWLVNDNKNLRLAGSRAAYLLALDIYRRYELEDIISSLNIVAKEFEGTPDRWAKSAIGLIESTIGKRPDL